MTEHYQKQADLGQRQLLAAICTLAKVRRAKLTDVMALVQVMPHSSRGRQNPNPPTGEGMATDLP